MIQGSTCGASSRVAAHIGKRINTFLLIIGVAAIFCLGCGNSNTSQPANAGNKSGPAPPNVNTPANKGNETSTNNAADTPTLPQVPGGWVDMPALANKSPEDVEKMVGKHLRVLAITEPPQEVPGEYRNYDLAGMKDVLTVRFYKGKAVAFTLEVPAAKALKTPEELGKIAGFELTGKTPAKATDFVSQWNGQFGPVEFAEVTIGKTAKTDYNLVRARIQQ